MPTYQYACTDCGHGFEAVQSFTDDALTECPQCTGRLRKVFNSVGVVFKGSGFYRTDSREAARVSSNGKDKTTENKPAEKKSDAAGTSGGSSSSSSSSSTSPSSTSPSSTKGSAA